MNLCCGCTSDFASVLLWTNTGSAKHRYRFTEGLELDAPVEAGRRCMDVDEMTEAGMELDQPGRWAIMADRKRLEEYWREVA
jgi:hypothetical protein